MRTFVRLSALLAAVALALALTVTAASAQPYDEVVGTGDTGADVPTEVAGETVTNPAQDTGDTSDDLAFTGRTVGGIAGVAVIAIVVGGVLVALSHRREGVTS